GPRPDQIHRVEQRATVVALVSAGALVPADWAGSFDIAVGQKALVVDRIDLRGGSFLDQPGFLQALGEMLGQLMMLPARGAAEPIERQAKAIADVALQGMLLVAITAHVEPCFAGAELGRSAVLVSGADEQDLVSLHAPKPRMHVRWQHRARQIAK